MPHIGPMFTIETGRETDGRWIAEVSELPGTMVYGRTRDEAVRAVKALALRVLADRIEHGEDADLASVVFVNAA